MPSAGPRRWWAISPHRPMAQTAAAAASSGQSGLAAAKAPARQESWHPVPVTSPIMGWPLRMQKTCCPSLTRSTAPLMAATAPVRRAKSRTSAQQPSRLSRVTVWAASTPWAPPWPRARASISERLPRMTVNRTSRSSCRAVSVRRREAPAPTGSSTTGMPRALAVLPQATMAGMVPRCRVPRFSTSPAAWAVISGASSGSSAIMGEAPQASSRLAQSLAVT